MSECELCGSPFCFNGECLIPDIDEDENISQLEDDGVGK